MPDSIDAQTSQAFPRFLQILPAHDFVFPEIGTAGHEEKFYQIRYLFA